jgi:hypothetical protein
VASVQVLISGLPGVVLVADGGIKGLLNGLLGDAKQLLVAGTGVMAIWFVIWSWIRTRSIVPTLGALLMGAVVLWGVNNVDSGNNLKSKVGEDISRNEGGSGGR